MSVAKSNAGNGAGRPGITEETREARHLLAEIKEMRTGIVLDGRGALARWQPFGRKDFEAAATNLAHYVALRKYDLAALQPRLSSLGLSSLGRSEGRVLASLDSVIATLSRLAGAEATPYPRKENHFQSASTIEHQKRAVFGADPSGPYSRIMVTLPSEAATDPQLTKELLSAGADCVRINCAHDDTTVWAGMIQNVRSAASILGRECRVLMDLAGPKCRIASVGPKRKPRVFVGDKFLLSKREPKGKNKITTITISYPNAINQLRRGARVSINDGKILARVRTIPRRDAAYVELEVLRTPSGGARLRAGKGINFPSTLVQMPSLTSKDLADLDFVAQNADMVGLSFVQSPQDVFWLQQELRARRPGQPAMPIVLKVETRQAVANLPELIVQGAQGNPLAVMIARGDLAVELGFAELPEIQEQILWLCEAAHVPVIWATQVFEGLIRGGVPSRAEATDAAMAQRAECVMLNKGPWIVEGVRLLDQVLHRMDQHQAKKSARLRPLKIWNRLSTRPVHRVTRSTTRESNRFRLTERSQ